MGKETTRALQARRRETAARVERLIAAADRRNPIAWARRARIKAAVRDGRRELRALEGADQAATDRRARVGVVLARLADDGLSRSEAYEALGLSRAIGRRFFDLAVRRRTSAESSTTRASGRAQPASPADGGAGAQSLGGASNEGIL